MRRCARSSESWTSKSCGWTPERQGVQSSQYCRAMRSRGRMALAALSLYAIVWGATWAAGDPYTYVSDAPLWLHYPGVFAGGLPPAPIIGDTQELAVVIVAGVVGLIVVGVTLFVRDSRRSG